MNCFHHPPPGLRNNAILGIVGPCCVYFHPQTVSIPVTFFFSCFHSNTFIPILFFPPTNPMTLKKCVDMRWFRKEENICKHIFVKLLLWKKGRQRGSAKWFVHSCLYVIHFGLHQDQQDLWGIMWRINPNIVWNAPSRSWYALSRFSYNPVFLSRKCFDHWSWIYLIIAP